MSTPHIPSSANDTSPRCEIADSNLGACPAASNTSGLVETGWTTPSNTRGLKLIIYRIARHAPFHQFLLGCRMLRDSVILARNFWYDFRRTVQFSSAVRTGDSKPKLAALLTMTYHGVEKGLSLPNPRPGFGKDLIKLLLSRLNRYVQLYGHDEVSVVSINALNKYMDFNRAHGIEMPNLAEALNAYNIALRDLQGHTSDGGVKVVKKEDFLKAAKVDLTDFFASRSSVRQYSDQPVELDLIRKAVDMARKTPSCCNRQSGRVWVIQDRDKIQRALDIQRGTRGFTDQIGTLLIVTSDVATFQSEGERYQPWIDGALFGMTLVYALHSLGLVTCMLNWSKRYQTDVAFRREFPVPNSETIVFFLSVGHPPQEFRVPHSFRGDVNSFMKIIT